jgi:hypothetical protein
MIERAVTVRAHNHQICLEPCDLRKDSVRRMPVDHPGQDAEALFSQEGSERSQLLAFPLEFSERLAARGNVKEMEFPPAFPALCNSGLDDVVSDWREVNGDEDRSHRFLQAKSVTR